jgi:hypothetical protein
LLDRGRGFRDDRDQAGIAPIVRRLRPKTDEAGALFRKLDAVGEDAGVGVADRAAEAGS